MSIFAKIFGTNDNPIKPPIQAPNEPEQNNPSSQNNTPPQPDPNNSEPGFMAIDDVFTIKGRGAVVTGRVDSGNFFVNQPVTVNTATGPIQTTISSIESFMKTKGYASAGDNVGLLLKDVDSNLVNKDDTVRGM